MDASIKAKNGVITAQAKNPYMSSYSAMGYTNGNMVNSHGYTTGCSQVNESGRESSYTGNSGIGASKEHSEYAFGASTYESNSYDFNQSGFQTQHSSSLNVPGVIHYDAQQNFSVDGKGVHASETYNGRELYNTDNWGQGISHAANNTASSVAAASHDIGTAIADAGEGLKEAASGTFESICKAAATPLSSFSSVLGGVKHMVKNNLPTSSLPNGEIMKKVLTGQGPVAQLVTHNGSKAIHAAANMGLGITDGLKNISMPSMPNIPTPNGAILHAVASGQGPLAQIATHGGGALLHGGGQLVKAVGKIDVDIGAVGDAVGAVGNVVGELLGELSKLDF